MRHRRLGEIRRQAEVARGAWGKTFHGPPRAPAPTLLPLHRAPARSPLRAPATADHRSPGQQSLRKAGREHFAIVVHFPLHTFTG
jgi:hypothetical protein